MEKILKPGEAYLLIKPEDLSKIPVRKDLEVIPTEASSVKEIGWEFHLINENSPLERLVSYMESYPDSYKKELNIGDPVKTRHLCYEGFINAVVTAIEGDTRYCETESNLYIQEKTKHGPYWLDSCAINKECLKG